jgi:hypothetical protein
MVPTLLCLLVTVVESFAFPMAPIKGKEPPLDPTEAMATSPQPAATAKPLPLPL